MTVNQYLTTATALIETGFAVCEVAHLTPEGGCSCQRLDCPSPGKHPVGRGWMQRALKRRSRILPGYVRIAPATSYGLIPPPGSRLMVIDRDDPAVGLPMPPTLEVHRASADPRKGHYYFQLDPGIDESDVPRAFAGGEVRIGGSGHVVGPGSRHASGDVYEPNGADMAVADRELIDALRALPPVRRSGDGAVEAVTGSRHLWLTGQARKMTGWGWDLDRIAERLRELNDEYCQPPLSEGEAEFERIAGWAVEHIERDGPRIQMRSGSRAHKRALRAQRGWPA